MRNRIILLSATIVVLISLTASTASANRFSIEEDDFAIVWTALTFTTDAGVSVTCPVALAGSFHSRAITKTVNSLIGHVTSAQVGRCADGAITVLTATLPWHVAYGGFTGRLPSISGVNLRLIGAAYQVSDGGVTCLARTDSAEPSTAIAEVEAAGEITGVTADASAAIDIDDPSFMCTLAGDVQLSGRAMLSSTFIWDFFVRDGFGDLNEPNPDAVFFDDARPHKLRLI
jgi:hypothetical protein